jgi:uncharacterized protein (TIGR03435 family)
MIWIAGVAVFLLPVAVGLRQVSSLRRSALPWLEGRVTVDALTASVGLHRRVDVLLHESLPGPMTCGVLRAAIVLPADAPTWGDDDLRRAIVHELEHVRRGDWASQCVARIVAACYWFHPIVWIARRQLALEAERACDDAVIRRSDPAAYADQLVVLAKRLSTAAHQPQLAMANRSDLAARVVAVLDSAQPRGRAGALCVGAAIAVTGLLAVGMSSIRIVSAQTPQTAAAGPRPKYDAATIKPCVAEENPTGARGTAGGTNASFSPGRFFVPCVTTEQIIYLAYASYGAPEADHLENDDPGTASNAIKIRGGPAWVHSLRDKYQIEATASGATERYVLMGSMLQSLLEDRFHLKFHRDTEEIPLLSLTVGKGGFKLKPMKEGDCVPYDANAPTGPPDPKTMLTAKPTCGQLSMTGSEGKTIWKWGTGTVSSLANQLSRVLGIHIVDNTGITDKFVYVFEFQRDPDALLTENYVRTALEEQLGLKLDKAKGRRGFIAIDAIERPTPDGPTVIVHVPARASGPRGQRR